MPAATPHPQPAPESRPIMRRRQLSLVLVFEPRLASGKFSSFPYVALVGRGMQRKRYVAATLAGALARVKAHFEGGR